MCVDLPESTSTVQPHALDGLNAEVESPVARGVQPAVQPPLSTDSDSIRGPDAPAVERLNRDPGEQHTSEELAAVDARFGRGARQSNALRRYATIVPTAADPASGPASEGDDPELVII
jgi:hypothetical protein